MKKNIKTPELKKLQSLTKLNVKLKSLKTGSMY
jgi:hypothetical protein